MKGESKIWFRLYASCLLVEGHAASVVYDIERDGIYDIDNEYLPLLRELSKTDILAVSKKFSLTVDALKAFLSNFINSELGFYTTEPLSFPPIDLSWEMPYDITNSIVELDEPQNFSLNNIIPQLDELGCRSVQLRFLKSTNLNKLSSVIKYFKNSRINETEILFPAESKISEEELYDLLSQEKRISKFLVYNSVDDRVTKNQTEFYNDRIIYFKKDIRIDDSEIISKSRFRVNIKILSEAKKFNLGLNRKVCIDRKGQIKNYIGHKTSFGNINNNQLKSVISEKFKEMWLVSNDQIEGCAQCQYRYVCVSNSELKRSSNGYVKIEKCVFDPHTNIWAK